MSKSRALKRRANANMPGVLQFISGSQINQLMETARAEGYDQALRDQRAVQRAVVSLISVMSTLDAMGIAHHYGPLPQLAQELASMFTWVEQEMTKCGLVWEEENAGFVLRAVSSRIEAIKQIPLDNGAALRLAIANYGNPAVNGLLSGTLQRAGRAPKAGKVWAQLRLREWKDAEPDADVLDLWRRRLPDAALTHTPDLATRRYAESFIAETNERYKDSPDALRNYIYSLISNDRRKVRTLLTAHTDEDRKARARKPKMPRLREGR